MLCGSMILTCAFLACVCSCEKAPDTSEATGYFDTHSLDPSLHGDISTYTLSIVVMDPAVLTAGLAYNGASVALTAGGGTPPYNWDVHDSTLGSIAEKNGPNAVYQRIQAGDNVVILKDNAGNRAYVTIMQPANPLIISPPTISDLTAEGQTAVLTALGGTPPYYWSIANSSIGTLSSYSGTPATYTRFESGAGTGAGTNTVTLIDSAGNNVTRSIPQP